MFNKLTILCFFVFILIPKNSFASINLSPESDSWLKQNKNTVLIRAERSYPPFSFVSSNVPNARPKGLAVDYIELILKKVGASPVFLEAKSKESILKDIKENKEGIFLYVEDKNSDNLYFTESFISLGAVIVVRKDFDIKGELNLSDFEGREVSLTRGYKVESYISENYPKIITEPVSDDEVALQKLLLGEVDAAIMDLASLSYYTSSDVVSYVKVAGQTGFKYNFAFATSKENPELINIINSGLKELSDSEHKIIYDKWISFYNNEKDDISFLNTSPSFLAIIGIGLVIIILLLIIAFRHSREHHSLELNFLNKRIAKKQEVDKLKNELLELQIANDDLEKNLDTVKSLEKEIQSKISELS